MRLGPILVPSAIVVAIGVIVAAQSGWLEGGGSQPSFVVRGDTAAHGAPPAANGVRASTSIASATTVPTVAAKDTDSTSIGRSVGRNADAPQAGPAMPALGSGGASLDADGAGSSAAPPTASTPDALQQARDEAAKAKQDVFDVTQASIAAQHASEAEFERQKAELNDQIAQLRAKIDAASAKPAGSETSAAAEAKAATAMAELADARERETALRATLATAQAGGSADTVRKEAADRIAAAERAVTQAQGQAKELEGKVASLQNEAAAGKKAADDLAGAERDRADAQRQAKDMEDKVASLQSEVAAGKAAVEKSSEAEQHAAEAKAKNASDKVAALEAEVAAKTVAADRAKAAERALADAQTQAKALGDKVGSLQSELAASRSAAALVVAKAETAGRLKADLDAAQQREDALNGRVATLQAAADDVAHAQDEKVAAVHKVAALQRQLEDSRLREEDLGTKLAGLQTGAVENDARAKQARAAADEVSGLQQQLAASQGREKDLGIKLAALKSKTDTSPGENTLYEAKASDANVVAALRDDLAGARRGQDTLRRENGVLQRELVQEHAATKLINEKLAALQVGMGQPVPPAAPVYSRHERARVSGGEHERLTRQLEALRREQMHQEVQALRVEAGLGRPHRGRRPQTDSVDQSARFETVPPEGEARLTPAERRASRRRERQARERNATVTQPLARGQERFRALRQSSPVGDDSQAAIAQASSLIRSGNIDQARQVLRQRGGSAATRALADTYNPLTNTQYGAIGVDSDADKASYLYQQSAREAR